VIKLRSKVVKSTKAISLLVFSYYLEVVIGKEDELKKRPYHSVVSSIRDI